MVCNCRSLRRGCSMPTSCRSGTRKASRNSPATCTATKHGSVENAIRCSSSCRGESSLTTSSGAWPTRYGHWWSVSISRSTCHDLRLMSVRLGAVTCAASRSRCGSTATGIATAHTPTARTWRVECWTANGRSSASPARGKIIQTTPSTKTAPSRSSRFAAGFLIFAP